MAIVNMDLAELDKMRDEIKQLADRNKQLEIDLKSSNARNEQIIADLKSGSKVIVKTGNTTVKKYDENRLADMLTHAMQTALYRNRTYINSRDIQEILKEASYNYSFGFNSTMAIDGKAFESTITEVQNFEKLEGEVKQFLERKFTKEIKNYKKYIKSEEELKEIYNKQYIDKITELTKNSETTIKTSLEILETELKEEYTEKLLKLEESQAEVNNQKAKITEITKLAQTREIIIKEKDKLIKSLENSLSNSVKSASLESLLEQKGYRIHKGVFGDKYLKEIK